MAARHYPAPWGRYREEECGHSSPCWIWTGTIDLKGYGRLWRDGKSHKAHRLFYEKLVGPIPDGLHIDHLCMVKSCVNPAHLEPVTLAENNRRAFKAGRGNPANLARRTHCNHGHEFTPENTAHYNHNRSPEARTCRECQRIRNRSPHAILRPGRRKGSGVASDSVGLLLRDAWA